MKVAADIRSRLGVLPESLEASYWEIYEKILVSGDMAARLAIFTFRWLLYAKETISIDAFAIIASIALTSDDSRDSDALTRTEILDVCANLVVARDTSFVFAHLSVREFLERLQQRGLSTMDAMMSNEFIAHACIKHLQKVFAISEKFFEKCVEEPDFSSLVDSHCRPNYDESSSSQPKDNPPPDEDDSSRKATDPSDDGVADQDELSGHPSFPFERPLIFERSKNRFTVDTYQASINSYACKYWIHHVAQAREHQNGDKLATLIQDFCTNAPEHRVGDSFVTWCKVMSEAKLRIDHSAQQDQYPDIVSVCSELPPNPMWLPCLYSWLELAEAFIGVNFPGLNEKRYVPEGLSTYGYESPLTFSMTIDNVELVECLTRGYKIMSKALRVDSQRTNEKRIDPLARAVQKNDPKLVSLMLTLDYEGSDSHNDAFLAAVSQQSCEIMQLLMDETRSFDAVGSQALMQCCNYGLLQSFRFLLSKGCATEPSERLLYAATFRNKSNIVKELLQHGFGQKGRSIALSMATADGYNEIAAMLAEQGAVKDNLSVIREILHECPDNATRLIYADFDIHGRYLGKRQTALHYAAERGFERVVSALLENGASVDVYDLDRCTPLHLAARKGRVACVRLLLDSGADVLAEHRNGDWPLDVAEDCHHVLIETILRENMQRLLEQLQSQSKSKSSDPDIGDKSATEAIAEDWEVESNGPEIPVISVSPV